MPASRLRAARIDELVASVATVRDEELSELVNQPSAAALFLAVIGEDAHSAELTVAQLRPRRRVLAPALGVAAAILLVLALVVSVLVFHSKNGGRGSASVEVALNTRSGAVFDARLPNNAVHGGLLDWSFVPPYVAVLADGKVVGVVLRSELLPTLAVSGATGVAPTAACGSDGVDVYGPSLTTVVGHLFANPPGFVPLGQTPVCDGQQAPSSTSIAPTLPCLAVITATGTVHVQQCASEGGGETKGS